MAKNAEVIVAFDAAVAGKEQDSQPLLRDAKTEFDQACAACSGHSKSMADLLGSKKHDVGGAGNLEALEQLRLTRTKTWPTSCKLRRTRRGVLWRLRSNGIV